jgi:predicted PolB exonuclease-like 3'-5' exonuclease
MLNPDSCKGAVYFQSPGELIEPFEEDNIKFISDTEEGILKKFWDVIQSYEQMITFNGRGFDAPFLIIRSAVHRINPTTTLMPNRYDRKHLDLLDQLIFYGSVWRRFNLHMYCRAFGIKSPKDDGITGYEVDGLYKSKRFVDIARYCVKDLHATKELFIYWDNYIRPAAS